MLGFLLSFPALSTRSFHPAQLLHNGELVFSCGRFPLRAKCSHSKREMFWAPCQSIVADQWFPAVLEGELPEGFPERVWRVMDARALRPPQKVLPTAGLSRWPPPWLQIYDLQDHDRQSARQVVFLENATNPKHTLPRQAREKAGRTSIDNAAKVAGLGRISFLRNLGAPSEPSFQSAHFEGSQ